MKIVNETEQTNSGGVVYMLRGPQIDWGTITLQPGDEKGAHLHNEVDETFYITEGTTTFILGDGEVDVPAGTAIRLEAKESHGLKNKGQSVTKMVFIKESYKPEDKVNC
jgi:mannose-6-phosphate isomerase-like protein (cupin superfamily)